MDNQPARKQQRRRCHHCDNKACPKVGVRQIVENCPSYISLDPALRPPKYDINTPRVRIKRTVLLSEANIIFIEDIVLEVLEKHLMNGRVTRGVNYCVEKVRTFLGDSIPDIPLAERGNRGDMIQFSMTNTPVNDEFLVKIRDYYAGGNNPVSLSRAMDYCISMVKQAYEGQSK